MINKTRNASFARKSMIDLRKIVDKGSLGSDAATYWLKANYNVDYAYLRGAR